MAPDVTLLTALLKTSLVIVLAWAGVRLLWSAHVDRTPKLAARRDARIKPYVSPHSKPLPVQPLATRLEPGSELRRLTTMLDRAREQIQSVHQATQAAARQIDGAEIALNRLLQEISGVMPQAIAPTIIPRRGIDHVAPSALAA